MSPTPEFGIEGPLQRVSAGQLFKLAQQVRPTELGLVPVCVPVESQSRRLAGQSHSGQCALSFVLFQGFHASPEHVQVLPRVFFYVLFKHVFEFRFELCFYFVIFAVLSCCLAHQTRLVRVRVQLHMAQLLGLIPIDLRFRLGKATRSILSLCRSPTRRAHSVGLISTFLASWSDWRRLRNRRACPRFRF